MPGVLASSVSSRGSSGSARRGSERRQKEGISTGDLRLLVATSRPAVRAFLGGSIRSDRRRVVSEVAVSPDALAQVAEQIGRAHVAIVDVAPDPTAAIRLCRELHARRPELPVIALLCCSHSATPWHLRALVSAGVTSLFDLQATPEEVSRVLNSAAHGDFVLHLQLDRDWTGFLRGLLAGGQGRRGTHSAHVLSESDVELLELVALGLPDQKIGDRLHLSPHTVKHRMEQLRDEVGARNRIELAAWAGRYGLYRMGGPLSRADSPPAE